MEERRPGPDMQRIGLQIIAAALTAGPLLFLGVVLFLRSRPDAEDYAEGTLFTSLSGAFAVGALLAHGVFLRFFATAGRGGFFAVHRLVILRLAVTEAAALFACVAHLLEGEAASAVAAVVLVGWMAAMQFPTSGRLDRWCGTA